MPSIFDRILSAIVPEPPGLRAEVDALNAQMESVMVKQTEIDQKFEAVGFAITGITQDIADLKASVVPNEPMSQENFDKLSAIADKLAALDAETPSPAPPTT